MTGCYIVGSVGAECFVFFKNIRKFAAPYRGHMSLVEMHVQTCIGLSVSINNNIELWELTD